MNLGGYAFCAFCAVVALYAVFHPIRLEAIGTTHTNDGDLYYAKTQCIPNPNTGQAVLISGFSGKRVISVGAPYSCVAGSQTIYGVYYQY